jgi:hypothetical protein
METILVEIDKQELNLAINIVEDEKFYKRPSNMSRVYQTLINMM